MRASTILNLDVAPQVALFEGDISHEYMQAVHRARLVALDIETSGLDWRVDRIAQCQLYHPDGGVAILRTPGAPCPKRLCGIVSDGRIQKVFHHAMFDLRFMSHAWSVKAKNVACTKIAAKLLRFENGNGSSLQKLLEHFLGISVDKSLQTSNWSAGCLTREQVAYSVREVVYLIPLLRCLEDELQSAGLMQLAQECFAHIPTRVGLDVLGVGDVYAY